MRYSKSQIFSRVKAEHADHDLSDRRPRPFLDTFVIPGRTRLPSTKVAVPKPESIDCQVAQALVNSASLLALRNALESREKRAVYQHPQTSSAPPHQHPSTEHDSADLPKLNLQKVSSGELLEMDRRHENLRRPLRDRGEGDLQASASPPSSPALSHPPAPSVTSHALVPSYPFSSSVPSAGLDATSSTNGEPSAGSALTSNPPKTGSSSQENGERRRELESYYKAQVEANHRDLVAAPSPMTRITKTSDLFSGEFCYPNRPWMPRLDHRENHIHAFNRHAVEDGYPQFMEGVEEAETASDSKGKGRPSWKPKIKLKNLLHKFSVSRQDGLPEDETANQKLDKICCYGGRSLLWLPLTHAVGGLCLPNRIAGPATYVIKNGFEAPSLFRRAGVKHLVDKICEFYANQYSDGERSSDEVLDTVGNSRLPSDFNYGIDEVCQAFTRMTRKLPGGVFGSLWLFDVSEAIVEQSEGGKLDSKGAKSAALAICCVESRERQSLICGVLGLVSLVGHETTWLTQNRSKEYLVNLQLMDYEALGIMFGPCFLGELEDELDARDQDENVIDHESLSNEKKRTKGKGKVDLKLPALKLIEDEKRKSLRFAWVVESLARNWPAVVKELRWLDAFGSPSRSSERISQKAGEVTASKNRWHKSKNTTRNGELVASRSGSSRSVFADLVSVQHSQKSLNKNPQLYERPRPALPRRTEPRQNRLSNGSEPSIKRGSKASAGRKGNRGQNLFNHRRRLIRYSQSIFVSERRSNHGLWVSRYTSCVVIRGAVIRLKDLRKVDEFLRFYSRLQAGITSPNNDISQLVARGRHGRARRRLGGIIGGPPYVPAVPPVAATPSAPAAPSVPAAPLVAAALSVPATPSVAGTPSVAATPSVALPQHTVATPSVSFPQVDSGIQVGSFRESQVETNTPQNTPIRPQSPEVAPLAQAASSHRRPSTQGMPSAMHLPASQPDYSVRTGSSSERQVEITTDRHTHAPSVQLPSAGTVPSTPSVSANRRPLNQDMPSTADLPESQPDVSRRLGSSSERHVVITNPHDRPSAQVFSIQPMYSNRASPQPRRWIFDEGGDPIVQKPGWLLSATGRELDDPGSSSSNERQEGRSFVPQPRSANLPGQDLTEEIGSGGSQVDPMSSSARGVESGVGYNLVTTTLHQDAWAREPSRSVREFARGFPQDITNSPTVFPPQIIVEPPRSELHENASNMGTLLSKASKESLVPKPVSTRGRKRESLLLKARKVQDPGAQESSPPSHDNSAVQASGSTSAPSAASSSAPPEPSIPRIHLHSPDFEVRSLSGQSTSSDGHRPMIRAAPDTTALAPETTGLLRVPRPGRTIQQAPDTTAPASPSRVPVRRRPTAAAHNQQYQQLDLTRPAPQSTTTTRLVTPRSLWLASFASKSTSHPPTTAASSSSSQQPSAVPVPSSSSSALPSDHHHHPTTAAASSSSQRPSVVPVSVPASSSSSTAHANIARLPAGLYTGLIRVREQMHARIEEVAAMEENGPRGEHWRQMVEDSDLQRRGLRYLTDEQARRIASEDVVDLGGLGLGLGLDGGQQQQEEGGEEDDEEENWRLGW